MKTGWHLWDWIVVLQPILLALDGGNVPKYTNLILVEASFS
jgi:hypothetical protein